MEFKEVIKKRHSVRKFLPDAVTQDKIERIVAMASTAPSSHNSRSTRLLAITDKKIIEAMSLMRDFGSAFMKKAPLAIVVLGDSEVSGLWKENASISAAFIYLACVEEGLGSCWVHVDGRPCLKNEPDGKQAAEYLSELIDIPQGCKPLCVMAIGYPDE